MTRRADSDPGKVILAADIGSFSIPNVNLAVALAASSGSQLQGLFIEDEDLLRLTGLPCAREITLTTATERGTSIERMQRSLQLVASQFKQTLQQEAQALQVSWRFETVRGRVRDIGLKPVAAATLTILSDPVSHRLQSLPARSTRRILLLGKATPRRQQVLDMLLGRYARERVELTLGDDAMDPRERSDTMRWLQQHAGQVTLVELPRHELFARLLQSGAGYDCAIFSAGGNSEDMALLLKSLRCLIILIT